MDTVRGPYRSIEMSVIASLPMPLQSVLTVLSLVSHVTALLLLIGMSVRLIANLRYLREAWQLARRPPSQSPRVSVLTPARNEVATIEACVTSLMRQRYPDVEVIVLDDGSTDGTGQLLDSLQARNPDLKVIHSTDDPPHGWNGKSYACHLLAQHATGDWLLFTDADTVHLPYSIQYGVAQAQRLAVDLLSAFPYQQTGTWSERIVVSFIVDFLPRVSVDFRGLWRGTSKTVLANGQYLLARASSYYAIGGHASLHDALIDDFALARRFRQCAYKAALVDGASQLQCRMYHSFREVQVGFAKNVLGALTAASLKRRARWWAPLFAWGYACIFVIPFFNLLFSQSRGLAIVEIAWLLLLRGLAGWSIRRPLSEILTTPLAAWFVMALGLDSLYRRWRNRTVMWKGRVYPDTAAR
jgi:chlorobactene glucosyltransferase